MVRALAERKARWTVAEFAKNDVGVDDTDAMYRSYIDPYSGRRRSRLDLAWLRRGAGLRPVKSADVESRCDAQAGGMPQLTPDPGAQQSTLTFGDFCDKEIARIHTRLEHIVAASRSACLQSAEHSAEGHTALALHCDARAKMLALEEGLLKRALERWERCKSEGDLNQRQ